MLSPEADGKMAKARLIKSRKADMKKPPKASSLDVALFLKKDKSKSRAEDNKRLRQRKQDAGLVYYTVWVTPEQREALKEYLTKLK